MLREGEFGFLSTEKAYSHVLQPGSQDEVVEMVKVPSARMVVSVC